MLHIDLTAKNDLKTMNIKYMQSLPKTLTDRIVDQTLRGCIRYASYLFLFVDN